MGSRKRITLGRRDQEGLPSVALGDMCGARGFSWKFVNKQQTSGFMPFDPRVPTGNQLLDAIPLAGLEAIAPDFEWVETAMRQIICEPNRPLDYAYFPVSGLCSIIAMADMDDQVEMGVVGREGFIGTSILLLAGHAPLRVMVQGSGQALRLPAAKLIEASVMPEVRAVLLRFVHTFMVQAASTILANTSYLLEERLARWILMTQDRHGTVSFPMTHEFMSLMLAVRRAGVTETVHKLEGKHLIRATRGHVHVLHREGLEALAGGAYGQAEREHRRLIVPAHGRPPELAR
jgi:CRP-like cAMP-binding protein